MHCQAWCTGGGWRVWSISVRSRTEWLARQEAELTACGLTRDSLILRFFTMLGSLAYCSIWHRSVRLLPSNVLPKRTRLENTAFCAVLPNSELASLWPRTCDRWWELAHPSPACALCSARYTCIAPAGPGSRAQSSWSAGEVEDLPGLTEYVAVWTLGHLITPRLEPGPLASRTISLGCPASLWVAGAGSLLRRQQSVIRIC